MRNMAARVETLKGHIQVGAAAAAAPKGALANSTMAPNPTRQVLTFGRVGTKSPNDVVIVAAQRTAITRANRGAFKDTTPDDLLKAVLESATAKARVPLGAVSDIIMGNVQQPGSYQLPARTAQLRAGFPVEASLRSVNRQCASGLQAVASLAADIATGMTNVGIAAGVEHMTSGGSPNEPTAMPPMNLAEIMNSPKARDALVIMGITSENVAAKHGVSREKQDAFAAWSHEKALRAQAGGAFREEITPVRTTVKDKSGNAVDVVVDKDECPRPGSSPEVLAKLKPVFKPDGSTTAGNASPTNDGAAAVVMMRREEAERAGIPILGVFRGFKSVGVEPALMGVGPAFAIPALLRDVGLTVADVDVFEINEAFASQAVFCAEKLGIPTDAASSKLNPNGGAIALGHPLGATGVRQTTTLLHHLNRTKTPKNQLGVVSMCAGGGFGAAGLFEVEA